jgi:hypothetical protein
LYCEFIRLISSEVIFVVVLDEAVAALLRFLGGVEVRVDWFGVGLHLGDGGRVRALGEGVCAAALEEGRLLSG